VKATQGGGCYNSSGERLIEGWVSKKKGFKGGLYSNAEIKEVKKKSNNLLVFYCIQMCHDINPLRRFQFSENFSEKFSNFIKFNNQKKTLSLY
jgi:hypothetical protein